MNAPRTRQTMTVDYLSHITPPPPAAAPAPPAIVEHNLLGPYRNAVQRAFAICRILRGTPNTRASRAYNFPHSAPIWVNAMLNVELGAALRAQCADGESYVLWAPVGDRIEYAVLPADELEPSDVARRLEFD
jgi:hypothetical protein